MTPQLFPQPDPNQPERKFKGVWIPREVWDSPDLTLFQKCLWANISSLGTEDEPCLASNEWLGDRMESSASSIAVILTKMRKLGFIKDVSFDGRTRRILAVVPPRETGGEPINSHSTQPLTAVHDPLTAVKRPHEQLLKAGGACILGENKAKNKAITPSAVSDSVSAETIYDAYPRKAARKAGLAAIRKALKTTPAEKLLKATQAFAEVWKNEPDRQFCPYPATWFNQERFNDDPASWQRNGQPAPSEGKWSF